jgi:phosphoribosyl 1,2-cyclic phosphodiesterase
VCANSQIREPTEKNLSKTGFCFGFHNTVSVFTFYREVQYCADVQTVYVQHDVSLGDIESFHVKLNIPNK